jgi:hypothetical protein
MVKQGFFRSLLNLNLHCPHGIDVIGSKVEHEVGSRLFQLRIY